MIGIFFFAVAAYYQYFHCAKYATALAASVYLISCMVNNKDFHKL